MVTQGNCCFLVGEVDGQLEVSLLMEIMNCFLPACGAYTCSTYFFTTDILKKDNS